MPRRPLLIASALFLAAVSLATAQTYVGTGLTAISPLGGPFPNAETSAVNNSGLIVGTSTTTPDGNQVAFSYSGGTVTNLGHLGGNESFAQDVNSAGTIVGFSRLSGGMFAPTHAFSYAGGVMTDLGTLEGGDSSYAYGINSAGVIVGEANTATTSLRAFIYDHGTWTNLGTMGGGNSSGALDINTAGHVVGGATNSAGEDRAFLYTGGALQSLGTLGGTYSFARALNDSDQVVGSSTLASGDSRAFLYAGGLMNDLGTLGGTMSTANDINAAGHVVGQSTTAGGVESAFFYADGTMYNLNTLFAGSLSDGATTSGFTVLSWAYGINDSDVIVGYGQYFDLGTGLTDQRGFALTVSAVPEPSTYAAFAGLGALGLALVRRRRLA